MRFSVVIPAYNEERYLPRLLDSIEVARHNYSGGSDQIEAIVADNDSTDRTSEVAFANGARVVHVAKRCIAAARNGGARLAGGEIICFIDADSAIHPETFNEIDRVMNTGRYVWGVTGCRLERRSFALLVTYCMCMSLVLVTRLDIGLSFCRREDFEAIGGYDETRLYAEDVKFPLALRRLGRRRGQRLVRIPWVKALASTRKFDQFGDWHYFGMLAHVVKSLVTWNWHDEELANRYWYNPGR
ncbi:MAG TPA: glycosyltransferase [Pyrinomonadaceae bacterium]|jgi:glycosyltransferase involved in cell wall biosynthesis|nr:glycosyltransferase [Pyrinomonadaceae bacterium]